MVERIDHNAEESLHDIEGAKAELEPKADDEDFLYSAGFLHFLHFVYFMNY